MSNDSCTTLAELKQQMQAFVSERDWEKFHSPKNLSMSLAIEVAELMEHFQWLETEQSRELDAGQLTEAAEELADVFCYLLALANTLDVDITTFFHRKMERNRHKYPADLFRGRYKVAEPETADPGPSPVNP
jgi:NTP pyrophosphatase (non-canonical NTP hydrolase)